MWSNESIDFFLPQSHTNIGGIHLSATKNFGFQFPCFLRSSAALKTLQSLKLSELHLQMKKTTVPFIFKPIQLCIGTLKRTFWAFYEFLSPGRFKYSVICQLCIASSRIHLQYSNRLCINYPSMQTFKHFTAIRLIINLFAYDKSFLPK